MHLGLVSLFQRNVFLGAADPHSLVCTCFLSCQWEWRSLELWSRLTWLPHWPWDWACPFLKTALAVSSQVSWRKPRSVTSCASCISMATSSAACSKTASQTMKKVGCKMYCAQPLDLKFQRARTFSDSESHHYSVLFPGWWQYHCWHFSMHTARCP